MKLEAKVTYKSSSRKLLAYKRVTFDDAFFRRHLYLGSSQGPADEQKTVLSNTAIFIGFHSLV
jgi:hypothetical protein